MKVCIVSLGCPKNLVDSEVIAGHLTDGSLDIVLEPDGADAVIINTCGFVDEARKESMDTIREMCRLKSRGGVSSVVVVGCLVQRFRRSLKRAADQVDAFLPITDYSGVPALLKRLERGEDLRTRSGRGGGPRTPDTDQGRVLLTLPHVSYLRIAEGCNHRCSFCAIPSIRGRLKSKPMESLIREAEGLAALGVKEVNLVAEDTTDYGRDLEGRIRLRGLLHNLNKIKELRWIRILYAYPSRVTGELIEEMADNPKVLEYIDMPIQHISSKILKSMRRGTSPALIRDVISRLRERIPNVVLRTSVVVGYPGEGEAEFQALHDFLKEVRFERLGAFPFSPEEDTAAARLPNMVPEEAARERLEIIMALQRSIIEERNKSLVGTEEEVIVDLVGDDGLSVARTRADAPDIDCNLILESRKKIEGGKILKARISGCSGYDLHGVPVSESRGPRN